MYFVISSFFAVGAMFFTGSTVKDIVEKVEKESSQQLVLQQADDTFSQSDLLAHSSHRSHSSHSSHSSHRSHYSSR